MLERMKNIQVFFHELLVCSSVLKCLRYLMDNSCYKDKESILMKSLIFHVTIKVSTGQIADSN